MKDILNNLKLINKLYMGIGDWGLGIGDWGLGPIPNPQSPIPHLFINFKLFKMSFINKLNFIKYIDSKII
jgi:hypothetical protein